MFVIKKNVVLTRTDGGTGLLALEYFGGRTVGVVKMRCPEGSMAELEVDGRYFSAPAAAQFNLPFALNAESRVAARIVKNGGVWAYSLPRQDFAAPAAESEAEEDEGAAREEEQKPEQDESSEEPQEEKTSAQEEPGPAKEAQEPLPERAQQDMTTSGERAPQENKQGERAAQDGGRKSKNKGRGGKTDFLSKIKDSLEELFSAYPAQEDLAALVPNSAWVRVDTQKEGAYVVGVIGDESGKARYLCYGVPDKDNSTPPSARPECRGWLPVEEEGAGYWVMYQDMETGEIVTRT